MKRTWIVTGVWCLPLVVFATTAFCASASRDKPPARAASYSGKLKGILAQHRGEVLLLLLGEEGCSETRRATLGLEQYLATKPSDVAVLRMDVPYPGQSVEFPKTWNYSFARLPDENRLVADQLDFFYYPTFYVFDRDGELRYEGGYDKSRVETMVREILAEKPGEAKKVYTLPKPPIGAAAPGFSGRTLAGETITNDSLKGTRAAILLFVRTTCPYALQSLSHFKEIAAKYDDKNVGMLVVNQGQAKNAIQPTYDGLSLGVPVIWDRDRQMCKAYGVEAVPYYYLLDKNGTILQRGPFSADAAVNSLNTVLGIAPAKVQFGSTGAG